MATVQRRFDQALIAGDRNIRAGLVPANACGWATSSASPHPAARNAATQSTLNSTAPGARPGQRDNQTLAVPRAIRRVVVLSVTWPDQATAQPAGSASLN